MRTPTDDHNDPNPNSGEGRSLDTIITDKSGDLKTLAAQRKNQSQPSAYSSLCDWVANLAASVGYEVEKEMLRLPSTRNVGLVGRSWQQQRQQSASVSGHGHGHKHEEEDGDGEEGGGEEARRSLVDTIVRREKADLGAWVARAEGLNKEAGGCGGCGH